MATPLFADHTAPNFDDPFGMLVACHGRITRTLDTLARLQRHVAVNGCDHDARSAARNILRYFDTAVPNHHADEEESLFPRLVRAAPDDAGPLLVDLGRDHAALAAGWRKLRPVLAAIAAGQRGVLSPKQVADVRDAYASHIAREEQDLLTLAAETLDAATIAEIGREMARRRGVDPGRLPSPG